MSYVHCASEHHHLHLHHMMQFLYMFHWTLRMTFFLKGVINYLHHLQILLHRYLCQACRLVGL
jgi:hypothetical protein